MREFIPPTARRGRLRPLQRISVTAFSSQSKPRLPSWTETEDRPRSLRHGHGPTLYAYVHNAPVNAFDPHGLTIKWASEDLNTRSSRPRPSFDGGRWRCECLEIWRIPWRSDFMMSMNLLPRSKTNRVGAGFEETDYL